MIYLDHAATTPVPQAVAQEVYNVLVNQYGNPSAQYPMGQAMKKQVEEYRSTVAATLGCPAKNLYFTSCGTEGDNWAIMAALWQNRRLGKHIITTAVEHNAVLEPMKRLKEQGYEITYLTPDKNGDITARQLADALREDTVLVSIMTVNNETGNVYPIAEMVQVLRQKKSSALFHTDAVQAFMKVPCDPVKWGVDFMTISGHKIGAPKGVGALYIADTVKNPRAFMQGGGQEMGLRSGTEATAQLAGFAKAVELRTENLPEKLAHMAEIKEYCLDRLLTIPGLVRIGSGTAPHILMVSLAGYPSANVVTDLGAQDICLSAGSACHRGKLSHVVEALGLPKRTAGGVLRISFGPETTKEEIDTFCEALAAHQRNRFPML